MIINETEASRLGRSQTTATAQPAAGGGDYDLS